MLEHAELETKLCAARARLILDKPFLGTLVLRLPLKAASPRWCATLATDARALYYNPEYLETLSLAQTQFVLAHEALHCALGHFARRQHRVKHRWDVACDYAINPLLVADGLTPPPGALLEASFLGMTAEEIYPSVQDNPDICTLDEHLYEQETPRDTGNNPPPPDSGTRTGQQPADTPDAGGPQPQAEADPTGGGRQPPPPLSAAEQEQLHLHWQQHLAGAAQQALQAGKLSGPMARLVEHLLQPRLPWRMLLARYLSVIAREDYSYLRPSRREGDALWPSLRSAQIDLAVALDTSGSISASELQEFMSELAALKGQLRARVSIYLCDQHLMPGSPWVYEPWEDFRPLAVRGGGGTDFRPVFAAVALQDRAPDLLVYFSDAQGHFPKVAPSYPVLWLIKGRSKVPWGTRIQLN